MVSIEAIDLPKPDLFRLFMDMEHRNSASNSKDIFHHLTPPFDIIAQQPAKDYFPGIVDDSNSAYIIWLPILP